MKKSITLFCSLAMMMSLALTGCSSSETATTGSQGGTGTTSSTGSDNKTPNPSGSTSVPDPNQEDAVVIPRDVPNNAAIVLGVGGLGDQSYNDLSYAGMLRAEQQYAVPFDFAEPSEPSELEPTIRALATSKEYGVIVCVGFDSVEPLTAVAADFPEQQFAIIDGEVDSPNVVNFIFKEEEGSFLVGALSALMQQNATHYALSGTKTLGFIGAQEIPAQIKFNVGYQAGAKLVDAEISVLSDYIGGSNPFNDAATAKELSQTQNQNGAEIIFNVAGGAGLGIYEVADQAGFYAIGCNSNQNWLDSDTIVMSMIKKVDTAVFQSVIGAVIEQNLAVGETIIMSIANDGCDYSVDESAIDYRAEDIATIDGLKERIISGELVIPDTIEGVETFLSENSL